MSEARSGLAPRTEASFENSRFLIIIALFVILATVPFVFESTYITSLTAKIMIFAIAAVSLDLILGYGGMVSFGHAVYIGIGAYAVGILSFYGINDGYLQFIVAVVGSAVLAMGIGAISLRTGGLYFIMITFAFSQMVYYLGLSLEPYGGDDGMNTDRSNFGFMNLNQNLLTDGDSRDMQLIFYTTLVVLIASVFLLRRIVNSRFGMVVRGSHSNDPRMLSIGFPTFRYRLGAFAIAGAICGLAGALWANHQEFVTPEYIHWFISGEIMVMVIAGGMGTIFGSVLGAFAVLGIEEVLKTVLEDSWPIVFGPLLVLLALFARGGLWSMIPDRSRILNAFLVMLAGVFVAVMIGSAIWMLAGPSLTSALGTSVGPIGTKAFVKYLPGLIFAVVYGVRAMRQLKSETVGGVAGKSAPAAGE